MRFALGTSAATVRTAPMLLVDVETQAGITGHSYQFCYTPAAAPAIVCMLAAMAEAANNDAIAPTELWAKLTKRYTLIGVQGIVRMAMSLLDIACWDALAKAAGVPLVRYLGGTPRPVRAYN